MEYTISLYRTGWLYGKLPVLTPAMDSTAANDPISLINHIGIQLVIVFWSGQGEDPQTPKGKIIDPA